MTLSTATRLTSRAVQAVKLLNSGESPDAGSPVVKSYGCRYGIRLAQDPMTGNHVINNSIRHRASPGILLRRGDINYLEGNTFDSLDQFSVMAVKTWGPITTMLFRFNQISTLLPKPVQLDRRRHHDRHLQRQ